MLKDERLLSTILNSKKMHAKAKVFIFEKLDVIERMRHKTGKEETRDMHEMEVDFGEVQD